MFLPKQANDGRDRTGKISCDELAAMCGRAIEPSCEQAAADASKPERREHNSTRHLREWSRKLQQCKLSEYQKIDMVVATSATGPKRLGPRDCASALTRLSSSGAIARAVRLPGLGRSRLQKAMVWSAHPAGQPPR